MNIQENSKLSNDQFRNGISKINDLSKRCFDILVSVIALIFMLPFFVLIGVWIKRDSPGPVFYRGIRVGRGGKLFKILKFRTMHEDEEGHNGNNVTAHDDPRITRIGRFLRDTKLNELPQLMNVLRGEMSLVGPRPEDPSFLKHYNQEQREVLSVRPGITSLASVIYADEEKLLQTENVTETYLRSILPKKLRLDLLYVRNRSFLLDLDILFRTIFVFFPSFRKATSNAEDIVLGPFRTLRRLVSWFILDAVISFSAVGLAGIIWRVNGPLEVGLGRSVLAALLMTSVFTLMNWITGVQRVHWRYASASEAVGLVISVTASTFLLQLVNILLISPNYPLKMLVMTGILALVGFLLVRYRRQLIAGFRMRLSGFRAMGQAARERVLVVGAGQASQLTLWLLQNSPSARAFQVVGVVDDDLSKLGSLVHRVPVLGLCDRIPEIVKQYDIGIILFAIHSIHWERRNEILESCWTTDARTVVAPDILTFLRKGTDPKDRRTWFPNGKESGAAETKTPAPGTDELRRDIHILAELARRGEYASLAQSLVDLDELLREFGEVPSESKIMQIAKEDIVRQAGFIDHPQ